MPQIIALSNQKGGVGKTTVTVNFGFYLASIGKKVLLVDADPQGNLTKGILPAEKADIKGLYEAMNRGIVLISEVRENLSLLAGSILLTTLERSLVGEVDAHTRLQELFTRSEFEAYDYILIDTPPSLGVLSINALAASDYFIIPMKPDIYSMQGTNDLMETVSKVRKTLNPNLKLLGAVINEYDPHPVITREIREEIFTVFKEKLFSVTISKSVKVEEAVAEKRGVIGKDSKVKYEFIALGEEILERIEKG